MATRSNKKNSVQAEVNRSPVMRISDLVIDDSEEHMEVKDESEATSSSVVSLTHVPVFKTTSDSITDSENTSPGAKNKTVTSRHGADEEETTECSQFSSEADSSVAEHMKNNIRRFSTNLHKHVKNSNQSTCAMRELINHLDTINMEEEIDKLRQEYYKRYHDLRDRYENEIFLILQQHKEDRKAYLEEMVSLKKMVVEYQDAAIEASLVHQTFFERNLAQATVNEMNKIKHQRLGKRSADTRRSKLSFSYFIACIRGKGDSYQEARCGQEDACVRLLTKIRHANKKAELFQAEMKAIYLKEEKRNTKSLAEVQHHINRLESLVHERSTGKYAVKNRRNARKNATRQKSFKSPKTQKRNIKVVNQETQSTKKKTTENCDQFDNNQLLQFLDKLMTNLTNTYSERIRHHLEMSKAQNEEHDYTSKSLPKRESTKSQLEDIQPRKPSGCTREKRASKENDANHLKDCLIQELRRKLHLKEQEIYDVKRHNEELQEKIEQKIIQSRGVQIDGGTNRMHSSPGKKQMFAKSLPVSSQSSLQSSDSDLIEIIQNSWPTSSEDESVWLVNIMNHPRFRENQLKQALSSKSNRRNTDKETQVNLKLMQDILKKVNQASHGQAHKAIRASCPEENLIKKGIHGLRKSLPKSQITRTRSLTMLSDSKANCQLTKNNVTSQYIDSLKANLVLTRKQAEEAQTQLDIMQKKYEEEMERRKRLRIEKDLLYVELVETKNSFEALEEQYKILERKMESVSSDGAYEFNRYSPQVTKRGASLDAGLFGINKQGRTGRRTTFSSKGDWKFANGKQEMVNRLLKSLQEADRKREDAEILVRELEQSLRKAEERIRELETFRIQKEFELGKSGSQNTSHGKLDAMQSKRATELEARCQALEVSLEQCRREKEEADIKLCDLHKKLREKDYEIEHLSEEKRTMERKNMEIRDKINDEDEELENVSLKLKTMRQRAERLEMQLEAVNEEKHALEVRLHKTANELENVKSEASKEKMRLLEHNENMTTKSLVLQRAIERMRNMRNEGVVSNRGVGPAIEIQVNKLEAEKMDMMSLIATLESENEVLKEKLEAAFPASKYLQMPGIRKIKHSVDRKRSSTEAIIEDFSDKEMGSDERTSFSEHECLSTSEEGISHLLESTEAKPLQDIIASMKTRQEPDAFLYGVMQKRDSKANAHNHYADTPVEHSHTSTKKTSDHRNVKQRISNSGLNSTTGVPPAHATFRDSEADMYWAENARLARDKKEDGTISGLKKDKLILRSLSLDNPLQPLGKQQTSDTQGRTKGKLRRSTIGASQDLREQSKVKGGSQIGKKDSNTRTSSVPRANKLVSMKDQHAPQDIQYMAQHIQPSVRSQSLPQSPAMSVDALLKSKKKLVRAGTLPSISTTLTSGDFHSLKGYLDIPLVKRDLTRISEKSFLESERRESVEQDRRSSNERGGVGRNESLGGLEDDIGGQSVLQNQTSIQRESKLHEDDLSESSVDTA